MNMLVRCSVLAAFATAAGIIIAATPAVAGAWVADAKSGCQVWNPNPQLEETVAWSGSCANGRAEGHGTAQWVKGGATSETDEGEWRDGRQTGKGTQSWATGRYEGELSDGEPNGHGVLIMQKLRYEGDFRKWQAQRRRHANSRRRIRAGHLEGWMLAGCAQSLDRRALIGLSMIDDTGLRPPVVDHFLKEKPMKRCLLLRHVSGSAREPHADQCASSRSKGQELPHGATMPLGKFQKGLRLCEGVSLEQRTRKIYQLWVLWRCRIKNLA